MVAESSRKTGTYCLITYSPVAVVRDISSVLYYRPSNAFHCQRGWWEPECDACMLGYSPIKGCASRMISGVWESADLQLILTFKGDDCAQITGIYKFSIVFLQLQLLGTMCACLSYFPITSYRLGSVTAS